LSSYYAAFVQRFNLWALWVGYEIVSPQTVEARAAVVHFFIDVATV